MITDSLKLLISYLFKCAKISSTEKCVLITEVRTKKVRTYAGGYCNLVCNFKNY